MFALPCVDVTLAFDLTTGVFEETHQYGDPNDIIFTFDRGLRVVLNIDVSGRSCCFSTNSLTKVFERWRRICALYKTF